MARAVAWLRGVQSVLDTFTTISGLSWVMAINRDTNRLHIFDGIVAGGIPLAKLSDIPDVIAAVYNTPSTGGTVTASVGDQKLQLTPLGTLATLTVILPPSPVNDDEFRLSTSSQITDLTVSAPGGATVLGGSLLLTANGGAGWRYRGSGTTWFRTY